MAAKNSHAELVELIQKLKTLNEDYEIAIDKTQRAEQALEHCREREWGILEDKEDCFFRIIAYTIGDEYKPVVEAEGMMYFDQEV